MEQTAIMEPKDIKAVMYTVMIKMDKAIIAGMGARKRNIPRDVATPFPP